MVRARNRIVEDDHDAVSEKPLQRAFILEYQFSHVLVVLAENGHDLFRFGCLGEGGRSARSRSIDPRPAAQAAGSSLRVDRSAPSTAPLAVAPYREGP